MSEDTVTLYLVHEQDGSINELTPHRIGQLYHKPSDWFSYLQMAMGGPPARMTINKADGTAVATTVSRATPSEKRQLAVLR
jgi:hypothetical protein